jgi:uncharacterized protein DUF488
MRRAHDPNQTHPDAPTRRDGRRILVERLWPRGMKEAVAEDAWMKEGAPSTELRQRFDRRVERSTVGDAEMPHLPSSIFDRAAFADSFAMVITFSLTDRL